MCLFILAQAVSTYVIYVRRQLHGCTLSIDHATGIMAFSSAIVGFLSLAVLLPRWRWTVTQSLRPEQRRHTETRSFFAAFILASVMTAPLRDQTLWFIIRYLAFDSILEVLVVGLLLYIFRQEIVPRVPFIIRKLLPVVVTALMVGEVVKFWVLASLELSDRYTTQGCWKDPLSDILFVI